MSASQGAAERATGTYLDVREDRERAATQYGAHVRRSVDPGLGWEGVDGQWLHVHRLVFEPVAVAIPERVLQPVDVVALRIVAARLRAARLAAGFRRYDRRLRRLYQVVELERFDARCIEYAALVLDRRPVHALLELHDLRDTFGQQLLVAEHAAMRLHRLAQVVADV